MFRGVPLFRSTPPQTGLQGGDHPARNHAWPMPPYLVALALLERGGQRALTLTGKSPHPEAAAPADPGADGCTLALELLLTG